MKFVSRTEPCPCNSGRKYKHCCYARDRARANQQRDEVAAVRDALQQAVRFQQAGRLPEAEARYQRVLQLNPALSPEDLAGIHYNLGNIQLEQGRPEEAVASYRRALEIQPHVVEISGNLGGALNDLGRLEEAAAVYRGALAVRPGDALLHFNLGNVLSELGDVNAAVGCYQKAIALKPDFEDAHADLAAALNSLGRLEDEAASIRARLALKPDNADLYVILGHALMGQGKDSEAFASFRQAASLKPDSGDATSNTLWLSAYRASLEPQQYLELAREWEQGVVPGPEREAARRRRFPRPPLAGRRLRVGYVSGDFRQHAVSYFIEHILKQHDRTKFEIFAYYTNKFRDDITARIEGLAEHWLPVAGLSGAVLREHIEADGIDVLVDLSGHTGFHRLGMFARRAAPVQTHYLGYFASTGLTEMDYWIGDDVITPPEMDSHFCEQVWRLPRVWKSYQTIADAPVPDWRPAGDGTVWLVSCNNLGKMNPETFALWSKVLHALPEGRLRLKTKELFDTGNRKRVLDAMASHGIAPDRLDLQRESDWVGYMAQYNSADIALDPVASHGGGTITCDALWMGVPVIHALGSYTSARYSASMLSAIGRTEWIARTEQEYVDKVVALARNVDLRRQIRSNQRNLMAQSPLCDARGLAKCLEDAYVGMYERWLAGQGSGKA